MLIPFFIYLLLKFIIKNLDNIKKNKVKSFKWIKYSDLINIEYDFSY